METKFVEHEQKVHDHCGVCLSVIAAAITFFFVISEHSVVAGWQAPFFGLMTLFIYGGAGAAV